MLDALPDAAFPFKAILGQKLPGVCEDIVDFQEGFKDVWKLNDCKAWSGILAS